MFRTCINNTDQQPQTATSSPRAPLPTHTLHATPNPCPDPRSPKPRTAQTSPKSSATTLPAAHHTTSPLSRNSSFEPSCVSSISTFLNTEPYSDPSTSNHEDLSRLLRAGHACWRCSGKELRSRSQLLRIHSQQNRYCQKTTLG